MYISNHIKNAVFTDTSFMIRDLFVFFESFVNPEGPIRRNALGEELYERLYFWHEES